MSAGRFALIVFAASMSLGSTASVAQTAGDPAGRTLTGQAAFGDWHGDAPGVRRRLTPSDMPKPFASQSASNTPSVVDQPIDATLKVPPGYSVRQFASGLTRPRLIRVAPNGDIFVAETEAGRIRVMRAVDGAYRPYRNQVFASDLDGPFGIAFYPPGPDPQWVYVANNNSVVRFPYRSGDFGARGEPQVVVPEIAGTSGYHTTRDVQFSQDGRRMFVSVGSGSNVAEEISPLGAAQLQRWETSKALGAAWGEETNRADVLAFDPDGGNRRIWATGIRNCVGLAIQPTTGDVWCSTNERDQLGDNLVPDYVTRVLDGAFYGWPWYYIGANEDPRKKRARPDLASHVTVPDVLIQPHSAPLAMTFYKAPENGPAAFPADVDGDAFVALHGSWNRSRRTGYKIVRIRLHDGVPSGTYEDFLTGFVADDDSVWGRPVGVTVAHDGALLISEDANGTLWRVAYTGHGSASK